MRATLRESCADGLYEVQWAGRELAVPGVAVVVRQPNRGPVSRLRRRSYKAPSLPKRRANRDAMITAVTTTAATTIQVVRLLLRILSGCTERTSL